VFVGFNEMSIPFDSNRLKRKPAAIGGNGERRRNWQKKHYSINKGRKKESVEKKV
jgi:hypothetical protein